MERKTVMKILITGACGFVGSSIAESLLKTHEGLHLTGIDNLSRKGSETNVPRLKKLGVEFIQGDIRYMEDLDRLPAADWVIDCAANPSVLAGFNQDSGPEEVVGHNLIGTLRVLEFCRKRKAGLILLSTSRVYSTAHLNSLPLKISGSRFELDWQKNDLLGAGQHGINENFPAVPPLSLYGATKLASEIMALEYGNAFSFPVWINRCSVLGGPGQFGKADQGILSYWIYQFVLDRPLCYIGYGGKGFQIRDFFHPHDLEPLISKQLREPLDSKKPRVLNFGGGLERSLSLAELTAWCEKRSGVKKQITADSKNRMFDVPYYISDTRSAAEIWNWKPSVSLEEIFNQTWDWAVQNKDLIRSFS